MSRKSIPGLLAAILGATLFLSLSCTRAPLTEMPPPTETEVVLVQIVTATEQPTLEATTVDEPTITPLATFTPISLNSPTATKSPTAVKSMSATPKPTRTTLAVPAATATRRAVASPTALTVASPTPSAPTLAPTSAPSQKNYPAPVPISPGSSNSYRDGDDMKFYFASLGGIGADECYLVHLEFANPDLPGQAWGDDFVDPGSSNCGDQTPEGKPLTFVVYRGRFKNQPNYGTILNLATQVPAQMLEARWFVQLVRLGPAISEGHYQTTPLSPRSGTLTFPFHPG